MTNGLGVTTHPDFFRRHVRYFAKNYDLIEAADLLRPRLPKRPMLITFDDAYRSVLDIGGPVLREFNAPSIWFMNPGSISELTLPIDNLVAYLFNEPGGSGGLRGLGLEIGDAHASSDVISRHIINLTYAQVTDLTTAMASRLGSEPAQVASENRVYSSSLVTSAVA